MRQIEQAQLLHHGVHLLTVTVRGRREQPDIGCATHQQVLGHGVGDAATLHLRKVGDAAGTLRRGQRIQRLVAQMNAALGERMQTNQAVQQGRLTHTVATQNGEHLTALYLQVHVAENPSAGTVPGTVQTSAATRVAALAPVAVTEARIVQT